MIARTELATALAVCAVRVRVGWLLATCPLDVCLRELSTSAGVDSVGGADPRAVERIGRWTARLLRNRRWPPNTCLQRAMTRYALLVAAGARATFVMGVRDDADIEGHAWVLLDGTPWMEHRLDGLRATFQFPAAA